MTGDLVAPALSRATHLSASLVVFFLGVAPIRVPSGPPDAILTADIAIHFGVHGALGALAAAGWGLRAGAPLALWLAVYFEAAQLVAQGRSFGLGDLSANLAGAGIGALLASRLLSRGRARG